MSYSQEFRGFVVKKIVSGMSRSEAVSFFNISADSVYRWLKEYKETGCISIKKRKEYRPKKISKQALIDEINSAPDATLEEISKKFLCSQVAVWKRLKTLGITRKKNNTLLRAK
jgi:transposase